MQNGIKNEPTCTEVQEDHRVATQRTDVAAALALGRHPDHPIQATHIHASMGGGIGSAERARAVNKKLFHFLKASDGHQGAVNTQASATDSISECDKALYFDLCYQVQCVESELKQLKAKKARFWQECLGG